MSSYLFNKETSLVKQVGQSCQRPEKLKPEDMIGVTKARKKWIYAWVKGWLIVTCLFVLASQFWGHGILVVLWGAANQKQQVLQCNSNKLHDSHQSEWKIIPFHYVWTGLLWCLCRLGCSFPSGEPKNLNWKQISKGPARWLIHFLWFKKEAHLFPKGIGIWGSF